MALAQSSLITKNIMIGRNRTSIKLEALEIRVLDHICARENLTIHEFCSSADRERRHLEGSRTGRIRMAILSYFIQETGKNAVDRSEAFDIAFDGQAAPKFSNG